MLLVAFVFVLVGENGLESFCFPVLLSHFVMKVIQVSQNDPGRCYPPYHVSKLPGQAVFCEGWISSCKSLDAASLWEAFQRQILFSWTDRTILILFSHVS